MGSQRTPRAGGELLRVMRWSLQLRRQLEMREEAVVAQYEAVQNLGKVHQQLLVSHKSQKAQMQKHMDRMRRGTWFFALMQEVIRKPNRREVVLIANWAFNCG